jgi:hypothetical protein
MAALALHLLENTNGRDEGEMVCRRLDAQGGDMAEAISALTVKIPGAKVIFSLEDAIWAKLLLPPKGSIL